jgi:hypothetical protein
MDGSETGAIRFRNMPKNVRLFVGLWFATYPLSALSLFLAPVDTTDVGISPFTRWLMVSVLFAAVIALDIWLCWKAAWRRKNWARWTMLVILLITSPWIFADVATPATLLDYLIIVMDAAALFFVFTGDARPWFGAPDPAGTASNFD